MRHDQHLHAVRNTRQAFTDCGGSRATNAAIHFVKDQRWHGRSARQHDFQRQHQPRQFAARGDFRERAWRLSWVGRDQEGHAILPIRAPGGFFARRDVYHQPRAIQL